MSEMNSHDKSVSSGCEAGQRATAGTSTQRETSSTGMLLNVEYLISPSGIFKIIESVLSLITFVCAVVYRPWYSYGGGWVIFVSLVAFILTVILFFLYLTEYIYRLPGPFHFVHICYYGSWCLFWFITAIVASARSSKRQSWIQHPSITATAVFAWFTFLAFVGDTIFLVLEWRNLEYKGLPGVLGSRRRDKQRQTSESKA